MGGGWGGGETHQDELEEGGLVYLDELGVEGLRLILGRLGLLGLHVVLAVLDHLGQDLTGNVRKRDSRLRASICVVWRCFFGGRFVWGVREGRRRSAREVARSCWVDWCRRK